VFFNERSPCGDPWNIRAGTNGVGVKEKAVKGEEILEGETDLAWLAGEGGAPCTRSRRRAACA